jgi:hypothetical protein
VNAFRTPLTGIPPTFEPSTPPARIPEPEPMSIINDTAEEILRLLKENGGTISGAELRTHLADVSPANRLKAITNLRNEGRLKSTGATTLVVYHLPGVRQGASKSAAMAAPEDQFDRAERMADSRLAGHPDFAPASAHTQSGLEPAMNAGCLKVPLIGEARKSSSWPRWNSSAGTSAIDSASTRSTVARAGWPASTGSRHESPRDSPAR